MLTKIKAVRVQEVIVSGSAAVIGNIKYNNLEQGKPLSTKQLPVAKPLFTSIKQLPTVNESLEESETTIVVGDSKAGWAKVIKN